MGLFATTSLCPEVNLAPVIFVDLLYVGLFATIRLCPQYVSLCSCLSTLFSDLFCIGLVATTRLCFTHISHLSVNFTFRPVQYLFSHPVHICLPQLVSLQQSISHLSVNFVFRSVLCLFATTGLSPAVHLAPFSQLCF